MVIARIQIVADIKMKQTAVSLAMILLLLGTHSSQALNAMACLNNHGRTTVDIRCPGSLVLSLTQIQVGYALNSCITNLSCPLEALTDTNDYYKSLMNSCDGQRICQLSSRTLYTDFANQFSRCQHSGQVRNLVKVAYTCVRVSTTAPTTVTTTPTTAASQGFSLPALAPFPNFQTRSPDQNFFPSNTLFSQPSVTTRPPPATTTRRKETTTTAGTTHQSIIIGNPNKVDTTTAAVESTVRVTPERVGTSSAAPATKAVDATQLSTTKLNSTTTINSTTEAEIKSSYIESHTTTSSFGNGSHLRENAGKILKESKNLYLDQTDEESRTESNWVTHILAPFIAGLVMVVIVMATVITLAKRRRRRKSAADHEMPVRNEFSGTLSTTYDTISGFSGFTGHYEDMYYNEDDITAPKNVYYSTTDYSSADYSTPSDPEPSTLQRAGIDQNYEEVSVFSEFTESSMHDTVSYETPIDVYDECADDTDTERPPDVYAEIKKPSTKHKDLLNSCIDLDDEPAILIVNDVYECTDLPTDDPLKNAAENIHARPNAMLVDNDLYNICD